MGKPYRSIPPLSDKEIVRFWSRIDKNGPIPKHCPKLGSCWLWKGTRSHGRAVFSIKIEHGQKGTKLFAASRVMYFLETKTDPGSLMICHHCDDGMCVRFSHFFKGTMFDNMNDCARKNRLGLQHRERCKKPDAYDQRGTKNHQATLTDETVREIRRIYAQGGISMKALGERFGVQAPQVCLVVNRRAWAHVL